MTVLDIIYTRYFDPKGEKLTIGGIQTYITRLSDLATRLGLNVRIFQYAEYNFNKKVSAQIEVVGIPVTGEKHSSNKLYKEVLQNRKEGNKYISLFATDTLIPSKFVANSIAIQHGIYWDIESTKKRSFLRSFISKTLGAYHIVKRLRYIEDVVCVDNNFICWYRTQLHEHKVNLTPIMNFTPMGPQQVTERDNVMVKLVFARRFCEYRGTRIFAKAIKRLLVEKSPIKVTFTGEGPDEQWLKEQLKDYENIEFTHYNAKDSVAFHAQFDIAVVPTTGSEGTSLSLLEAMSAHCAVLCTNVGGMTNIILDGYNGIMVSPDSDSIYHGLKKLIENASLRNKIAEKGYETVKESFNLKKWEEKWTQILKKKM